MTKVAPSILAADYLRLADSIDRIGNADYIHIDVMDGHFVPNLTFGPGLVKAVRQYSRKFLDVHLMVEIPEAFVETFADAGADGLTVHAEGSPHLHRVLQMIRGRGLRPAVALNPATPLSSISEVLEDVDMVLVMTVNPGFGGQALIPQTIKKVSSLAEERRLRGLHFEIEVDGGVSQTTAPMLVSAGADVLVAGTSVFGSRDAAEAIEQLRHAGGPRPM